MQRQVRFGRDSARVDNTTQVTERTQFFSHETARYTPQDTGMLQQAFAGFFGDLAGASMKIEEARLREEWMRQKLEQEALKQQQEEQKRQLKKKGEADAYRGNGMTVEYAGDTGYKEAYMATRGKVFGSQMEADWKAYAKTLPSDVDVDSALQDFLDREWGQGTGDDYFDAAALENFRSGVEEFNNALKLDRAKQQVLTAREGFSTELGNRVRGGRMEMDDLRLAMEAASRFFPGEEDKAKPWVLEQIMASIDSPQSMHKVSSLLNKPGLGPNGESLAQMFPGAVPKMEADLIQKFQNQLTVEGYEAFRAIDQALMDPELFKRPDDMADLMATITEANRRYGGNRFADEAYQKLNGALGKYIESTAEVNKLYNEFVRPSGSVSQSEINKGQVDLVKQLLTEQGLSGLPWDSDQGTEIAAAVARNHRHVATDLRDRFATMLTDPVGPEQQIRAFRFFDTLDKTGMDAKDLLQDHQAYVTFLAARALQDTHGGISGALEYINGYKKDMGALPKATSEFDWPTLMGSPGTMRSEVFAKASKGLMKEVSSVTTGLSGWFDPEAVIAPSIMDSMMHEYGTLMHTLSGIGVPGYEKIAREAVAKSFSKEHILIPGQGKRVQAIPNRFHPDVPKELIPTPDRLKNWGTDVETLAGSLPGLMDVDDVAVIQTSETLRTGAFRVVNNGQPLFFSPGQEIALDGEIPEVMRLQADTDPENGVIALSKDRDKARDQLQAMLGSSQGFGLEEFTYNGETVWALTYSFHDSLPTLQQRAEGFAEKAAAAKAKREWWETELDRYVNP